MDADGAAADVLVVVRVVYQDGYLLRSNLSCSVAKDEQHGINHVGFPASIRADNGCETLCVVCAGHYNTWPRILIATCICHASEHVHV